MQLYDMNAMKMNEVGLLKFIPGFLIGLAIGLLPLFMVHIDVSENPVVLAFRSHLASAPPAPVPPVEDGPSRTPTVYVITPTYARSTQQPDLVRVSQSLMLSRTPVHWILIEDSLNESKWLCELLNRTGLLYTHMTIPSTQGSRCRGINQRNAALDWIEQHADEQGVVYFGDDDNSYDHRLFEQMSAVTGVALHPTGGFTQIGLSTPVVVNGTVIALEDFWPGGRRFPIDMACLSVNVGWWKRQGSKRFTCRSSQMETLFVESLDVKLQDIQPMANNATQILVWHTKTQNSKCLHSALADTMKKYPESNLKALYNEMICEKSSKPRNLEGS